MTGLLNPPYDDRRSRGGEGRGRDERRAPRTEDNRGRSGNGADRSKRQSGDKKRSFVIRNNQD